MCEVGVCSVYITQDTEEKNAACVLLYQYSCISSGSLLQGWTLLRCWHLYVCLLSKVGMGSSNRLFAGIIKLPNLLRDSRCVLVFLCLWVCVKEKEEGRGLASFFFFFFLHALQTRECTIQRSFQGCLIVRKGQRREKTPGQKI